MLLKLVILSLLTLHCSAVSTLFRFGPGTRDRLLPRGQETIDLELQQSFLFDGVQFSNISISSQGVLSLGQPLLSDSQELSTDQFLIAPFWTYSQSGQVYYRESNDSTDLSGASQLFGTAVGRTVTVQSVIVVTWSDMLRAPSATETNTFQCVIGVSGRQTFVIFNYLTEGMQWAGSPFAQVGMSSETRVTALPTSGTEQTLQVSITGNIGEEGSWLWQVDGAAEIPNGIVGWDQIEYNVAEGGSLQVCLSQHNGNMPNSISTTVTAQSGSAETPKDFFIFGRRQISADTSLCTIVRIVEDTIVEDDELFTLTLERSSARGTALLPLRTTVRIQDNDNATVTHSNPTMVVAENTGELRVCGTLKDAQGSTVSTEKDVRVGYYTRAGTAVENEDFVPVVSGDIVFQRGTAEACSSIVIQNDNVFENDETFYVGFSQPLSQERITIDTVTMAIVTIQDDDITKVTIEYDTTLPRTGPQPRCASHSHPYTVSEGDSVTICLSITSGELQGTFDVFLQTRLPLECVEGANVAAVSGTDYFREEATFTFNPSNVREPQCITVRTEDDNLYEGREFFGLEFTSNTRFVRSGRALVFIEDNDDIDVSLIRSRFDFTEGQASRDIEICANRTGNLERRLIIGVTLQSETATPYNQQLRVGDYVERIQSIMFEYDEILACSSVTIIDDYHFEDEVETFNVWLSHPDTRLIHFPIDSATVAIHDNEKVKVQFRNPSSPVNPGSVTESDTLMPEVCLVRDVQNTVPIRVFLTPISGTATENEDYIATEEALVFEPSLDTDMIQCPSISLELFDDPVVEGDEQVLLALTSMEPERIIVTDGRGNPRVAALTIKDDDKVIIHMAQRALTVNEGEGSIDVCVSFRGYTSRPFSVSLSTREGTAIENVDYEPNIFTLDLPPTNETILSDLYTLSPSERLRLTPLVSDICVRLPIINDQVLEEISSKQLFLVLDEDDPNLQLDDPRTVSITITDDDSVTVDMETESITVSEDVGMVRVCAHLNGTADFPINARFITTPISASAGSDYLITSTIIVFPPLSAGRQCIELEIMDDNVLEHTEELSVRLILSTRNSLIRTGANDSLTVVIIDNDFVEVEFSGRDYSVLESAGTVEVCALLRGRAEREVSAIFSTRDSQRGPFAMEDVDYIPVSNTTLFNSRIFTNGGRECVTISLTDDESLEDTESFEVVLRSGDSGVRTTAQSTVNVYVLDDDGVRMGMQEREYEVPESRESFPVCLELIGRIEKNISVELFTDSITARSDVDFTSVDSQQVVFQASQADTQILCVNFSVIDDTIYEATETFSISLVSSADLSVSFHISNATVFILDDDRVSVSFEAPSYEVVEEAGQVEVCLVMEGVTETGVECVITTQPDSATLGDPADYTFSGPVSLVFPPSTGTGRQCTLVSVVDDEILESDEQFILVAVTNSPRVIVSQNETTVTIMDDDTVSVGFVQLSFNVSEDAKSERNITLCVQLTGEIERNVMVNIATTSSEQPLAVATAGNDYVPLERELVYRPDQMSKTRCVIVEVLDNRDVEPVEQFDVSIIRASPGVRIPKATRKVTISISDEDVICERSDTDTSRGFFEWQPAYPNELVTQMCMNGTASRRCNSEGVWEPPQVDNCYASIDAILKHILKNLPTEDGLSVEYLRELIKALHRLRMEDPEGLDRFIKPIYTIFEDYAENVTNNVVLVREVVYGLILNIVDIFHYPEWPKWIIQEEPVRLINSVEAITVGLIGVDGFKRIKLNNTFLGFSVEKGTIDELIPVAKTVIFEHFADRGVVGQLSSVGGGEQGRFLASISLPSSISEQVTEENIGLYFAYYDNDALFPLPNNMFVNSSTHVISPVVMATVSKTTIENLKDDINYTIVVNGTDYGAKYFDPVCVSWDFTANEGKGNWSTDGCELVSENEGSATCSCTHLTNFAVLLDIQERSISTPGPKQSVPDPSIIVIVGVGISLLGLTLTIITLILFSNLRKRDTTVIRIQFCLSVALMLLAFVCGIARSDSLGLCVSISAFIHYFTLVSMLWLAAEALLMVQKLLLTAKISMVYFVIASIVCWLLPVPAVVVPIGIDTNFSIHENYCFISHDVVFYAAFLGPIAAILLFNILIFFIGFVIVLIYSSSKYNNTDKAEKRSSAIRNIFTILTVMLLFGLTWIFGAFTVLMGSNHQYFEYLFVIFNAFQGLFIFLIFVVFAKETREMWLQTCGCKKRKEDDGIYELGPSRRVSRNPSLRKTDDDYDSEIDYNFDGTDRLEALKAMDKDARINMNSWDVMYIMPQNTFDIFLDSNQFQPPLPSVPMASAATAAPSSSSQQSSPAISVSPKRPGSVNDAGIREDQSTADSGISIMMDQSKNGRRSPRRLIGEPITTVEESETKSSSYHVHSVSGIGYVSADSDDEFLDRASPPILVTPPTRRRSKAYGDRFKREMQTCVNSEQDPEQGIVTTDFRVEVQ